MTCSSLASDFVGLCRAVNIIRRSVWYPPGKVATSMPKRLWTRLHHRRCSMGLRGLLRTHVNFFYRTLFRLCTYCWTALFEKPPKTGFSPGSRVTPFHCSHLRKHSGKILVFLMLQIRVCATRRQVPIQERTANGSSFASFLWNGRNTYHV